MTNNESEGEKGREREKKVGGFWLTTNKLVFWKIVLVRSHQRDADIKHRGGGKRGPMYV